MKKRRKAAFGTRRDLRNEFLAQVFTTYSFHTLFRQVLNQSPHELFVYIG